MMLNAFWFGAVVPAPARTPVPVPGHWRPL